MSMAISLHVLAPLLLVFCLHRKAISSQERRSQSPMLAQVLMLDSARHKPLFQSRSDRIAILDLGCGLCRCLSNLMPKPIPVSCAFACVSISSSGYSFPVAHTGLISISGDFVYIRYSFCRPETCHPGRLGPLIT